MGGGHSHGGRPSLGPAPRRLRVLIGLLVGPLVLATVVGLAALWPDGDVQVSGPGTDVERGTATVLGIGPCQQERAVDCQAAEVDLLSGPGAPGRVDPVVRAPGRGEHRQAGS